MGRLKYLIIGLIVGIALSIGVLAEGFTVLPNPFPIFINGQQAKVEAYNINGRTFLALGDIAKYFNATAALNETTKQIEVNNNTVPTSNETLTLAPQSTIPRIEIDKTTGNPIGAEFVEYKNCKQAVKYNDLIYVSWDDLRWNLGINSIGKIEGSQYEFEKNNIKIVFDYNETNSHIYIDNQIYYGVNKFSELLGE